MLAGQKFSARFGALAASAARFARKQAPLYIALPVGTAAGFVTGHTAAALFKTAAQSIVARTGLDLTSQPLAGHVVDNILHWSAGSVGIVTGLSAAAGTAYFLHHVMSPAPAERDCRTCRRVKLALNNMVLFPAICAMAAKAQGAAAALSYLEPHQLARQAVMIANVPAVALLATASAATGLFALRAAKAKMASAFGRAPHP